MSDPREQNRQADPRDVNKEAHTDPSRDLEIRPEDVDFVKGGARRSEDPCQGGERSKKLP